MRQQRYAVAGHGGQGRNEQTGRTIMQTNPEDKYEVKKFCFVWLAPGMKRGAT